MQKELQEARCEAGRKGARCASLEREVRDVAALADEADRLRAENQRLRRHGCSLQHDVTELKDEKCDLYVRYAAAIEEKSAASARLHDLNLQVGGTVGNTQNHLDLFKDLKNFKSIEKLGPLEMVP